MIEAPPGAAGGGLLVSLRRLLASTLELAKVRLELIGVELEEQKQRILGALVWAAIGVMLLGVAVLLLAGCIVLLFGEAYRLHALAVLALAFGAGGTFALRYARSHLQTPPGAFDASATELAQDRAALAPQDGGEEQRG